MRVNKKGAYMVKTSLNLSETLHKHLKDLSIERKMSMSRFAEVGLTVFIMLERNAPDTVKTLEHQIDGNQQQLFDLLATADRKPKLKK
jgi:uncharacterized protein Yka (UPF0111/DUF47 family)